ncbi:MAG: RNA polymerase sigma factor [Bacteroidota bacterium]
MSTIEFFERFNKVTSLLHAFAFNLTKNKDDAQDLYQETAFRAIKNKEKFIPGTNFKAWLMTIMKNIFINDYRKRIKRNTIMDATDNNYFINSGNRTVVNRGGSNMLIEELTKMIEELEDGFKIPFLMHYQGYKYHEIADQMELPLGTVKSRIFFARKELKKKIKVRYPVAESIID